MLDKSLQFKSFQPPCLTSIGGLTYVCPGWHVVPKDTTLEEVYARWIQEFPKETETKPIYKISEIVKSSKGDKDYKVTFDGTWWNCDCVGFGFYKKCKHCKSVMDKHTKKIENII